MEVSEHRRVREMAAAGAWLIYEVGETDRDVLKQVLEIPNEPDCSPYVMGLEARVGAGRVGRVMEVLEAARERTGLHYSEFQRAMLTELAKPGTVHLPPGLTRAPFGQLKVVEFPPEGSGRPVSLGECMTASEALALADAVQWPNVRRIYGDHGQEAATFTPSAPM